MPSSAGMRLVLIAVVYYAALGCWEQIDDGQWFPQMKRQEAVQAFELNKYTPGHPQGLTPPEGTVPTTWGDTPDVASLPMAEQEALQNPVPMSLESLKNGQVMFERYCATCHGPTGAGDGAVAGPPFGTGPFGLVLPIGGATSVARNLTDGHIYTTISIGRGRMPNYARIDPQSRWDLVNYVRELNGQGANQ